MFTLAEKPIKLIIFFLVFHTVAFAKDQILMKNSLGDSVTLRLAISRQEQTQGLSGLKSSEFKSKEGMLFINIEESPRTFWMIDTYFNLDITFLDQNLKIVGIEKDVPAHPGPKEPPAIFRTKTYQAQYVLETKAHSSFSKKLKIGDQLQYMGVPNLSEIVLKIRQQL